VGKTTVIYVKFLRDGACEKLSKSANVSRSYSKKNTGTVVFLRHGVVTVRSCRSHVCRSWAWCKCRVLVTAGRSNLSHTYSRPVSCTVYRMIA